MALSLIVNVVIIASAIKIETSDCYRILGIFPLAGRSHVVLGEHIMKALASKGHQVDVISHFPLKESFPNYNDLSIRGSAQDMTNKFDYSYIQSFSVDSIKKIMEYTGDPVCKLLEHPVISNIIENPPNDPPYDLVIMEYFTAHCYLAFGERLNVPMIGFTVSILHPWLNGPLGNPSNLAFVPTGFEITNPKQNFLNRLKNVLFDKTVTQQFNKIVALQKKYVDEYFGPGYPSIYELSKKMALVFVNTHYSLNGVQPLTQGVVEIGGLHIDEGKEKLSKELQKWLDESTHGCVFISFGSMVTIESFPKETIGVFYAAFKNLAPTRILMKIVNTEKLPPGLPVNVKTQPWFPQIQILKHKNVKAFVTHGGLMSTLEAIHYAVPMVGLPLFGDQKYNMEMYQNKKIAILFDYRNLTEEKLTSGLNTVLKDPEVRENIERVSKLYKDRPMSPKETVVFWVEYIIRHGNVLKSPAVDLAWWQVELLDVYGFILSLVLIILYILFLSSRMLIKCIHNVIERRKNTVSSEKKKKTLLLKKKK